MQQQKSALPSVLPFLLAMAILVAVGYFLVFDLNSSSPTERKEHTVNPPIEILEPEPAVTIIEAEPEIAHGKEIIEQEATEFVDNLAPTNQTAEQAIVLTEEEQGSFIRYDGKIILPNLEKRDTSISQLLSDEALDATTKITIEFIEETESNTTLAELSNQVEDQTVSITIKTPQGEIITAPLAELLAQQRIDTDAPITLITKKTHNLTTTVAELDNIAINKDQAVTATINHGEQALSINEIIQQEDVIPENAIFYLHRVTESDYQGLWGIIQAGLIDKFRQGISLEGIARNKDLVQVTIPHDADEKLPNGLSSFLGKLLNNKVSSTYVYNYKTQVMGFDPDVIHPGQQLLLIRFSSQELKEVYQFFSEQRNQNAEAFAVSY